MGTHSGLGQRTLLCPCGAALPAVAGRCRRCYQRSVLARDRGCCVACGIRPVRPHVHHRRPGIHDRRWLATVCPRCHTRIHKLASLARGWMPPRLIELWAEQHPHTPLQLQFAWKP